jgi:hypothetical protein
MVLLMLPRQKWARLGSNQRPDGYEPPALTTELHAPTNRSRYDFPDCDGT